VTLSLYWMMYTLLLCTENLEYSWLFVFMFLVLWLTIPRSLFMSRFAWGYSFLRITNWFNVQASLNKEWPSSPWLLERLNAKDHRKTQHTIGGAVKRACSSSCKHNSILLAPQRAIQLYIREHTGPQEIIRVAFYLINTLTELGFTKTSLLKCF
jgi:hypothetical protein